MFKQRSARLCECNVFHQQLLMFVIFWASQHVLIAYCVSSQLRTDIKAPVITPLYRQPLGEHILPSFSVRRVWFISCH